MIIVTTVIPQFEDAPQLYDSYLYFSQYLSNSPAIFSDEKNSSDEIDLEISWVFILNISLFK